MKGINSSSNNMSMTSSHFQPPATSPSAKKVMQQQLEFEKDSRVNQYLGRKIGQYKVGCYGRCVRSPDFPCAVFTAVLIIVPTILMIVFG